MKTTFLLLAFCVLSIGLAAPVLGAPGSPNTWVQTSSGMPDYDVSSIAFSPNYATDHTVFAATYAGVYKSTDSGISWVLASPSMTYHCGPLAFSPNYAIDKVLMVAVSQGIYVTKNDGVSWTAIHNNLGTKFIEVVAFSPNYIDDHTLFAGTFSNGLYKANWDSDTANLPNWTPVSTIPTDGKVTRLVFSPNFAADHIAFAGVPIGTGRGIYKSTNSGVSWRAINNWNPQRTLAVESLAISPNFQNDGTLFTSLHPGVYKSIDGGESWNILAGAENMLLLALAISPDYAIDGTVFGAGTLCEGACLTTNGGRSWRLLNAGFPIQSGMNIKTLVIPTNETKQPFNIFSGNASGQTPFPVWQMLYQNWRLFLPMTIR
jgi:hypothetical protein